MGVYSLVEGKMVDGRAVWQKQGEQEWFLYYACNSRWMVSIREHMEVGGTVCTMYLNSTALTPDRARPSEMWNVGSGPNPEIQVRRQQ
jgi:hypothetical protein